MDARNLPGPLKIAILARSLDPGAARVILQNLDNRERQVVDGHMAQLGTVSPDLVEKVAQEFADRARRAPLAKLAAPAGGAAKGQGEARKGKGGKLEAILALEPEQLFKLIKDEHPQTIAVVLVHAKTDVASDVISRLADDMKTDVAVRIAHLEKVNSGMVEEINSVLEEILANKETSQTHETGGVERLAEILNQADEASGELIMSEIEESNPELAAQIKQKMFVFEDIILVDDKGFQKLLRKVETGELAVALKAASEEVKEKVFRNMSARAGEMLREEIGDMGPVRMNEVSTAQQKITSIIQDMEFKGELIISGRRGEALIA